MNPDQPINTIQNANTPTTTPLTPENKNPLKTIWAKVPQKIKDILIRFYLNKKIFWLVTGAFSLIFLTILVGLLFGSAKTRTQSTKKVLTATPQIQATATPEVKDALTETDDRLKALKSKIDNLDVKQSRISPPQINFKVSF